MNHLKTNRMILGFLSAAIEQHPDWRFHQILQNLNINLLDTRSLKCFDLFYETSEETLERVKRKVAI
jgi:hypothetical protein